MKKASSYEVNGVNIVSNERLIELLEKLQRRLERILDCACIPREKYVNYKDLLQIPMALGEILDKLAQVAQQDENSDWPRHNVLNQLIYHTTEINLEGIGVAYASLGDSIEEIKICIASHTKHFSQE
ncbi:hypothetical protein [Ferrimonas balearica]|uniref:hypothetical protein n=1 Tax=Ferrimonas balearica TaxID=44012 RepID=UPI001C977A2D|nr:hypothetical protein [Ferrimonas balearica]MBY6223583.1 hypothetical protein [Ferrimonas balearica]